MLVAALLIAAVPAAIYLILDPPSADLAAQTFRADLFAEHGFAIWNEAWYSGHHLPAYSLLYPPLGASLGPQLIGAVAAVVSAMLFAALARFRFADRAWIGSIWFAAGVGAWLFTGRLTFLLGLAIGLAALVALQRGHLFWAGAFAALCALASPVTGLFVALAGIAVVLAGDRRGGVAVAAGSGLALAALLIAFPTGGVHPFDFGSTAIGIVLLALAALVLLPDEERALRLGAVLYGVLGLAALVLDTPLGGNVARLGALFGGPVLALGLVATRRWAILAVVALPLLYWQANDPVRDLADALADPSTERAFHEPLLAELDRRIGEDATRVHVLPTRDRWEAVHVAERFPLARGWLRQAESDDFDEFTDGRLTPAGYRRWLDERGVSYVAVPDAQLDYLGADEGELIDDGVAFLRPVWRNPDWRLYRVDRPQRLAEWPARVVSLRADGFELRARRSGSYLVRVRYTPYFEVTEGSGCVERAGEWTRVSVTGPPVGRPDPVVVRAQLSLGGVLRRDRSCSG